MKGIAVLLTTFLVGACTASPIDVGPKECAKGPEYWCQNIQTATSCGAVKHCIQTGFKIGSDVTCQDCKTFGKDIQDMLHSQTKDQIKQKILNICQQFTQQEVCREVINNFFDTVYDYILNNFDPDQLCKLLQFCDSTNNKHLPKMMSLVKSSTTKRLGDDIECEFCQAVLQHLKDMMVTNTTKEELKQVLLAICTQLGSYAQQCTNAVNTYLDIIYNFLVNEFDPKALCTAVGLCNGSSSLTMKKFPSTKLTPAIPAVKIQQKLMRPLAKQKNDNVCQFCEMIMGILKVELADNKTKEAIENALNQVCNELPTSFQQECRDFVDNYVEQLIDLLQKEDPAAICSLLGLCQQMKFAAKELRMDECDACQVVIDYIDQFLEDNDTEQEITNALEVVCDILPQSIQQQCESIIETYGPEILQELAQILDGETVCTAIGLCSQTRGKDHLVGGKKCTYGPAYWCKSVQHARLCNAEEHCKKFVWKN